MVGNQTRVLVTVADVDSLAKMNLVIDKPAHHITTSVYALGEIFPMLPEKLSTDLTPLIYQADRLSILIDIDMGISLIGEVDNPVIYRDMVRNHAKLTYRGVAAWLGGNWNIPGIPESELSLVENL